MALKGPRPALLLLLLLLVLLPACLALGRRETRHEKFHRQHVDFPKTSAPDARRYCNLLMPRRNLTADTCKPTNTFIHAGPAEVDGVCHSGGTPSTENYYDSNVPFELTTCRLAGGAQRPPCNYRGRTSTQRIRVACVGGLPVHYKTQL
ncbi:putative RNA-binding protein Luc7-like 1 [Platysternon megacephalum]|uniref:Ribonuclease n=1 Tax=Platysternon megacephalum TaxID=55544 RepID=A0A4D9DR64_9SAUR|nr:putative RNA-binding protein Luc7-like 1 [Platysternon megacephalum]